MHVSVLKCDFKMPVLHNVVLVVTKRTTKEGICLDNVAVNIIVISSSANPPIICRFNMDQVLSFKYASMPGESPYNFRICQRLVMQTDILPDVFM